MIVEKYKDKLGYKATVKNGQTFVGFTRMEAINKALEYSFEAIQRFAVAQKKMFDTVFNLAKK